MAEIEAEMRVTDDGQMKKWQRERASSSEQRTANSRETTARPDGQRGKALTYWSIAVGRLVSCVCSPAVSCRQSSSQVLSKQAHQGFGCG